MAGQADNRYGDRGRMPTITEGVATPTTATVGSIGDIRFDTNGNEWKCLNTPQNTWNTTDNYIWASPTYINANTEQISRWDSALGKIVYKALIIGETPASTGSNQTFITTIPSGAGYEGLKYSGVIRNSTGVHQPLPIALSTVADAILADSYVLYTGSFITIYFKLNAALTSKPFYAEIEYVK